MIQLNILAIGAHPDDIELGCGGTLLKAARHGHNVFMYVVTRGEKSGDPHERSKELFESARFIKARTLWLDNFGDAEVTTGSKLVSHIEYFIHRTHPDIIFSHATSDYHHDHRAIAECTVEAGRNNQNILAYEMPVTENFTPRLFYDITDVIDEKVKLIELFASQRNKIFARIEAVRGMAAYRALQSRLNTAITHVESFEVIKLCFASDFTLLSLPQKALPQSAIDTMKDSLNDIIEFENPAQVGEVLESWNMNTVGQGSGSLATTLFDSEVTEATKDSMLHAIQSQLSLNDIKKKSFDNSNQPVISNQL